jgi:hypothetical protein
MENSKLIFLLMGIIMFSSCMIEGVNTRPFMETDVAVGVAPGPDYIWINKEFVWRNGAYITVPGYWARKPHSEAIWNKGHWHKNGKNWIWERGHWD